jgi:phospholipase C
MANGNSLASVSHVVVLMLENRSFDHMLGFLYPGNVSPSGAPFEGLTGTESNPGTNGQPVTVFKIEPATPNAYLMPGADPGEGYMATNDQLYGNDTAPPSGTAAPGQGYVANFGYTLGWQSKSSGWPIVPGTVEGDIMGCFTPEALPVLAGVTVPVSSAPSPAAGLTSHLEQIREELISRRYPAGPGTPA